MSISSLISQRDSARRSSNAYASRRDAVKKIINKIDGDLDDNVSRINNEILKCIDELEGAMKGVSATSTVLTNMQTSGEKYVGSDSFISSSRSNLSAEVNRCQSQINSLNSEINWIDSEISRLRALEEEQQKKNKKFFWE